MANKFNFIFIALMLVIKANGYNSGALYIAHLASNKLSVYNIDSKNGLLVKQSPLDLDTGMSPCNIGVLANNFIYISSCKAQDMYIYKISKNSTTPIINPQFSLDYVPYRIRTDLNGRYLYVMDQISSGISLYKANINNGIPIKLHPDFISAGAGVAALTFNPANPNFAYAVNYSENTIWVYRFESDTGYLYNTNKVYNTGVSPRGIWFDNLNHGYVINSQGSSISMFQANFDGSLTELPNSPMSTGVSPMSLRITNNGYLYTVCEAENKTYQYKITSNGTLQPLNPASVDTGNGPRSLNIFNNKYLYTINANDSSINQFEIQENGNLVPLSTSIIYDSAFAYTANIASFD